MCFLRKWCLFETLKTQCKDLLGIYVSMGNLLCRHTVTVRLHTLVMFHQHNQQFIPVKLDLSLGREMLYKLPVDAS